MNLNTPNGVPSFRSRSPILRRCRRARFFAVPRVEQLEDRSLLATIFVDDSAAAGGNGAAWLTAYNNLQDGLTHAVSGDEIWVAAGTYKPTTGTNRAISFNLKSGVSLYGGFAGNETMLSERDWVTNVTTLSGDISTVGDNTDNSYHVVVASGVASATLDGFTVSGGNANQLSGSFSYGGGILLLSSSPSLVHLTIADNRAIFGGGLYNGGGTLTLNEVTISGNSAIAHSSSYPSAYGCGIYNQGGSLAMNDVTMSSNSAIASTSSSDANAYGGGIYNYVGSLALNDVTLSSNSAIASSSSDAKAYGGGISNFGGSLTLTGVSIANNAATSGSSRWDYAEGGGIYNQSGTVSLNDVALVGNSAAATSSGYDAYAIGGGISSYSGSLGMTNVVVRENSATATTSPSYLYSRGSSFGGGIYCPSGLSALLNVAITGNAATTSSQSGGYAYAGGLYTSGSPTLTNVTIDDNIASAEAVTSDPSAYGGGMYAYSGSPVLTNVSISGNTASASSTSGGNIRVYGGGLYHSNGSPVLTNVTVSSNTARSTSYYYSNVYGGGIFSGGGSLMLGDVILSNNTASATSTYTYGGNYVQGGGLYHYSGSSILMNVTVSGNSASVTAPGTNTVEGGGIAHYYNGSLAVTNSIFWGNTASTGPQIHNGYSSSATVNYSIVQGGWSGAGANNLSLDPLFVNAAGGDLHLSPGSPAIDSGTNTGAPAFDLDGVPRPYDGDYNGTAIVDMGAYEFHNSAPTDISLTPTSIAENSAIGSAVGTLTTTDLDPSDTFTYELVSGSGDTDNGVFSISGDQLLIGISPDYEAKSSYTVRVQTTDADGLSWAEEFVIQILDVPEYDYGDAPDSYHTLIASGGAAHLAVGPRLGTARDVEDDGQPTAAANGDDTDFDGDDDDGVVLPTTLIAGVNANLSVTASAAGKLDAWIDFDRSGTFEEGEKIFASINVVAGVNALTIAVPANVTAGTTYARFRLSTAGGLSPTGSASDGEVEDYTLQLSKPAALSAQLVPDPQHPGETLLLVNGSANSDAIIVQPVPGSTTQYRVVFPGIILGPFAKSEIDRIEIHSHGGSDSIVVDAAIFQAATIYAGDGTDSAVGGSGDDLIFGEGGIDSLFGGAGNDVIHGGNDADYLYGGLGNDVLIGGNGSDWLFGEGGDDILIGSNGPSTQSALLAIQAVWSSSLSFNQRTMALAGQLNLTTVTDDGVADYIYGSVGSDWEIDYQLRDYFFDYLASQDKKN